MKFVLLSSMIIFAQVASASMTCQVLDSTAAWDKVSVSYVGFEKNEGGYVLNLTSTQRPSRNKSYVAQSVDDINFPGYCILDASICVTAFLLPNAKNTYDGSLYIGGDANTRFNVECRGN